jgi:hypothetical protein
MKTIDVQGTERRRLRVPAETGFEELDAQVAKYAELAEVEREAEERVLALTAELDQATAADRDDLAAALIAGEKEPKELASVAAAEKRLREAKRQADGAGQARRLLATQIQETITAHAGEWAARAEQELEAELDAWRERLSELEAKGARIGELVALRSWARGAIAGGSKFNLVTPLVHELVGPAGDPFPLGAVLAGLRSVGRPPEEQAGPHYMPGVPQPGSGQVGTPPLGPQPVQAGDVA